MQNCKNKGLNYQDVKNETGQLECVINNKGINSDELIVMFALFGMEE